MAAANNEFFEALSMLEHERGITAEYLIEKIKAAIVIAVKKNYEVEDDHVMVEIDPDKGYNLVTYDGVLNYPSSQLYKRHTSRSFTNTFQLDYYNPLAEHHYVEAGSKYIYRINKGYQNEIPWIDPVGFDPTNMTKYDDLRQRQQKDRAQQVRLHFQCVVALIAGTERRVFAGPAELFLME